jgi:alpha-mannosidase
MGRRLVDIVPHTHWDREWHSSFQTFRLRLVDVLDDLLPRLEADPSYAHFLLDGQMAVVDDYLAVRPEAEERLRRLAAAGRVAMGPWYALPDEFLVSGETLIRNLQLGLRRATRFGGAMEVGYLPDMFGHIAQMPQLLRSFGFEHAVVWRGVPSAIDRSGFWWSSPDGSTVRAEYLPLGYGNGALVPDDAKALVRRIGEFVEEQGDLVVGPVLWMNGTDHLAPQPWLGRVVAEANELEGDFELRICSLADHVAAGPTDGLPSWEGELRSGARTNLLMGVASNRIDVKQAAARAERSLERLAEPLSALFLPADDWPGELLDVAWLEVIRNSAHDSICACSVDEVVDAVMVRAAEATQIAEGLAQRALDALGATVPVDGHTPVIVNPSARNRSGVVELQLPGEDVPTGCQLVRATPAEQVLLESSPVEIATIMVRELEYLSAISSFTIETPAGEPLIRVDREQAGTLVTPLVRAELAAIRVAHPGETVRVRVRSEPSVKVLAVAPSVAGYSWAAWSGAADAGAPVIAAERSMGNGLVDVEVAADGTFAIDGHTGMGALVDGGDVGDTYNWCPPDADVLVTVPTAVSTRVIEAGPVRARLEITRRYSLPTHATTEGRHGVREVEVVTTLELHADDDLVRVQIALDNHGTRDHRLRVHLPLPEPAASSVAECAFATVERGLAAEGGSTELGLPTFPSRRFVSAGGLTVVHEGLLEHELVDHDADGQAARTLAITLLRATGMLSQGPMATRPLPAGPLLRLEGPQSQGRLEASFALHVGGRDPYALADDAQLPLLVTRGGGPGATGALAGTALTVTGAEVSAVVREAGVLQVRLFNPTAAPATARIEGRRGWVVDLRGRPVRPFEDTIDLGPWEIATASLA